MRIVQFIGTRPELIKLAPLAWAAEGVPGLSLTSYFTGQHVELVEMLAGELGIDFHLLAGERVSDGTVPEKIAGIMGKAARAIEAERPDVVVVQGDTISAFACAVAASYGRVPVAHVEAGLRSFDRSAPWPEENLRRQLTQVADLHFAPTELSRRNLRAEGIADATIRVVGNTVIDAVRRIAGGATDVPAPRSGARRSGILTMHRREMLLENGASNIIDRVGEVAEALDVAFVFPVHPSPLLRRQLEMSRIGSRLTLVDPVEYPAFIRMLRTADLVITDSGGIQEEATFLRVPTLCLRDLTERPEAVASGAVKLVGSQPASLLRAAAEALGTDRATIERHAFGTGNAGARIVDELTRSLRPA